MMIVSDIGGTYVRLARAIDGAPTDIQKYKAADFKNLGQALDEYCNGETGELLIAAAGADINGTWTITNNPQWSMEAPGWDIKLILNDFEAIAHALPALEKSDLKTLNSGNPSNTDFCVIGAGTGLGLAYYRDNKIQKTHGGHMPIACVTAEQWDVVKSFSAQKQAPVIFEDMVSGQNDFAKTNPRLFHEFLGLFAAQSVIHGHTYGGLYLTGGVIEGLLGEDAFDFDTFKKWFCFDAAQCVKEDIANTPIHIITDSYPALKGLIHARKIP